MSLTWKDIDAILQIDLDYQHEIWVSELDMPDSEEYAKEILKRFNEYESLINATHLTASGIQKTNKKM